jgi:outer membrane protein assembly factor BamB
MSNRLYVTCFILTALTRIAVFELTVGAVAQANDTWPCWRGPTGLGLTDEGNLHLTWGGPNNENVIWKSPLPGTQSDAVQDLNQSSPIIWKDRVFVISAYWSKDSAKTEFAEHHVACYSAADGRLHWDIKVPPGPWQLKDLRGGYAASTPCTDGNHVYILFGSSVLAAVDFDGHIVWRKEISPFAWDVAIGTSPVLAGGAVLVLADGTKPAISRLIAFDATTGEIQWERRRPEANFNHTTPVLIDIAGKSQLVIASSGALEGIDPRDGKVIWKVKNKGDVPTPAFGGGLLYSDDGRGGPGVAVDPTGAGDLTKTHVKWTTRPIPEGYSSPIIAGGFVYRLHNPGVLKCFELATGAQVFAERLAGVNAATSPVATADGRLYFAGAGKSMVLGVGPRFEVLATNELGDDSPASPAVADGCLYLKGSRNLYRIGKREDAPKNTPRSLHNRSSKADGPSDLLRQE